MLDYFNCANEVQVVERDVLKAFGGRPAPHCPLARDRCLQKRVRTASLLIRRVIHTRPGSPSQNAMVRVKVKLESRAKTRGSGGHTRCHILAGGTLRTVSGFQSRSQGLISRH